MGWSEAVQGELLSLERDVCCSLPINTVGTNWHAYIQVPSPDGKDQLGRLMPYLSPETVLFRGLICMCNTRAKSWRAVVSVTPFNAGRYVELHQLKIILSLCHLAGQSLSSSKIFKLEPFMNT